MKNLTKVQKLATVGVVILVLFVGCLAFSAHMQQKMNETHSAYILIGWIADGYSWSTFPDNWNIYSVNGVEARILTNQDFAENSSLFLVPGKYDSLYDFCDQYRSRCVKELPTSSFDPNLMQPSSTDSTHRPPNCVLGTCDSMMRHVPNVPQ